MERGRRRGADGNWQFGPGVFGLGGWREMEIKLSSAQLRLVLGLSLAIMYH